MTLSCAIVGTGPAALVAATILCRHGVRPLLFEKRGGPAWKLLVAGSSGLNVTHGGPEEDLWRHYSARPEQMRECLSRFGRERWLALLRELGEEPFLGTSRRYLLRGRTAAALVQRWTEWLRQQGGSFRFAEELVGIDATASGLILSFRSGTKVRARTTLLALGGGSWEEKEPEWPVLLRALGLGVESFRAANCGYSFAATPAFFSRHEGKAVKGVVLQTRLGARQGELMITSYGLEGTPVYTLGCEGPATLDLKPELEESRLEGKILSARGALAQRIEQGARLSEGALALLRELAGPVPDARSAARWIKRLPIELLAPRPLAEAISSRGGLLWTELGENLAVRKLPGLFAAGEMIDWDAPTGGFLIQGCVSMGAVAAEGILHSLTKEPPCTDRGGG